jgi:polysaccharide biosynthesis/export protein
MFGRTFNERRREILRNPMTVINGIYCLIIFVALTSCVTNRKVQYLQKDDANVKNLPKDSLMRTYSIGDQQYKVQREDLISVRIESLTPEEFDIYNRQGSSANNGNTGAVGGQAGNFLLLGELVDHHGQIPFILSGKVTVEGTTIYEIQDTLQSIANQYLKNPIVRARLLNYRFTVLGEVNKEGLVTSVNNRVSVVEAMGLAGGLGDLADRSSIKLIRQIDGQAKIYYINLLDENLFSSPFYYTQQSDIYIVPPLRQRPFRKYFVQNISLALSAISILLVVLTYSKN